MRRKFEDFWNAVCAKVACFANPRATPGVPKWVIFGAVNRVCEVCSKNPKMPLARPAQLTLRLPQGQSSRPEQSRPDT
jgi:hypothetical protein